MNRSFFYALDSGILLVASSFPLDAASPPFGAGKKSGAPHDRLLWRTSKRLWAAREGTAKLVRQAGKSDELYDLAADIGETRDLAAAKIETAKRLGNAVDTWNKELVPPAFAGSGSRKQAKAQGKQRQSVKS